MDSPLHQAQQESRVFSGWLQLLTAIFFWLFMILLTLFLWPDLYGSNFLAPTLLLLFLAVGGSFYAALLPLLALPVMMRVIFFLLLQWSVLLFWAWTGGEELGPLLVPWQGLRRFARWWITAVIAWWSGRHWVG